MSTVFKLALAQPNKRKSTPRTPSRVRRETKRTPGPEEISLPKQDSTPEALAALLKANEYYRGVPWPAPFNATHHEFHQGDARKLDWFKDE